MTNSEKYLKDGVDVEEFITELELEIDAKQGNSYTNYELDVALHEFFESQVKPTLSEDEKVILRNVSIDFRYIRREQNGALYFCVAENKGCVSNIFANGLFDCIQPRRRI